MTTSKPTGTEIANALIEIIDQAPGYLEDSDIDEQEHYWVATIRVVIPKEHND